MQRRTLELFNLSFLDILSGALGAVLFLFIVVPKGGVSPEKEIQLALTYDTIDGKFFGIIPDSLMEKRVGDSMLVVISDYGIMPKPQNCPPQRPCPQCPKLPKVKRVKTKQTVSTLPSRSKQKKERINARPVAKKSSYKGDLPSVPCLMSIELKWQDKNDNVDLFVCKENRCVFGGKRKNAKIGFWDSGKSKTSFWGSDLRTNQEAVRQFDEIIPGKYDIFVQFKESEDQKSDVDVRALFYTRDTMQNEHGKVLNLNLSLDKKVRTHIGTLTINEDGSFDLIENNN